MGIHKSPDCLRTTTANIMMSDTVTRVIFMFFTCHENEISSIMSAILYNQGQYGLGGL